MNHLNTVIEKMLIVVFFKDTKFFHQLVVKSKSILNKLKDSQLFQILSNDLKLSRSNKMN